jgi:hypothetical protein
MKQLLEIREAVNAAKNDGDNATDYRLDRLCEAVDALIGYVECGVERNESADDYPPVNEPTAGAQYDGAGHFVREVPAPGFKQPDGRRIPDEDRLRRQWPAQQT